MFYGGKFINYKRKHLYSSYTNLIFLHFVPERYTNHTGFLYAGILDIDVDVPAELQNEYGNGFVVTLMLDKVDDKNSELDDDSLPDDEKKHECLQHGRFLDDQAAVAEGWKVMRSAMNISNGIDSNRSEEKSKKKKKKRRKKKVDLSNVIHSAGLEEYVNGLLNAPVSEQYPPKSPTPTKYDTNRTPPATPNTQASHILNILSDSVIPLQQGEVSNVELNDTISFQDLAVCVPPHNPIYQPQEGDIMRCSLPPKYMDEILVRNHLNKVLFHNFTLTLQ